MKSISKVIIYGTNQTSEILINKYKVNAEYIIDNDSAKWGTYFLDKQVLPPEHLLSEDKSSLFVVLAFKPAGQTYKEIKKLLTEMGFLESVHFYTLYDILPDDAPYEEIRPLSDYAPWVTDHEFNKVFPLIQNNTLVDKYRAYSLWSLVDQVSHLDGALLEVGVWKGGTGALIAKKAELCSITGTVYLCDTFEGVVKASNTFDNVYKGGEHRDTNEFIVQELITRVGATNVKILKGIFPEETQHQISDARFSFCHIDVDVYLSAKDIFNWIWGKMVVGGIIVFDDYGFMSCEGITNFVNELKGRNDLLFFYNMHGVVIKMK
jgi:hypothetical protein